MNYPLTESIQQTLNKQIIPDIGARTGINAVAELITPNAVDIVSTISALM